MMADTNKDDIYKEIFKRALAGVPIPEIANEFGLDKGTINEILSVHFGLGGQVRTTLKHNAIIWEFTQNGDIDKICAKYKLSKDWIKRIIWEAGISRDRISDKTKGEVAKLYKSGMDMTDISKKTHIHVTTIGRYVKNYNKTKTCKRCSKTFEAKRNNEYCESCRKIPSVYISTKDNIQCNECGRIFVRKYKSYLYSGYEHFFCSRYCCNICQNRKSLYTLKTIFHNLLLNKKPKEIQQEFGICESYYYNLLRQKDQYLDIPPLYWSSDILVLKHNKWETSQTRINLLLRAKRERRAFAEWQAKQKNMAEAEVRL